jgi:aryl-alcohol dehydrogenase-like predicted oxidoreductase
VEYCNLGQTGVRVSPLRLGAMMFGRRDNPDHDDRKRIIHRALAAGINFVDRPLGTDFIDLYQMHVSKGYLRPIDELLRPGTDVETMLRTSGRRSQ